METLKEMFDKKAAESPLLAEIFNRRNTIQGLINSKITLALDRLASAGIHPLGNYWQTIKEVDIDGSEVAISADSVCRGHWDMEYAHLPLELVDDPSPERIDAFKKKLETEEHDKQQAGLLSQQRRERQIYEELHKKYGETK